MDVSELSLWIWGTLSDPTPVTLQTRYNEHDLQDSGSGGTIPTRHTVPFFQDRSVLAHHLSSHNMECQKIEGITVEASLLRGRSSGMMETLP